MTGSYTDALRALSDRPSCTDEAIGALEQLAQEHGTVWSDVAAGYYVRAQRDDQPSDLLHALKAADQALEASPGLPAAEFNRAIALEALGFSNDAVVAFDAFLKVDHSEWAAEARSHRDALEKESARAAAMEWPLNRRRLVAAVRSDDHLAVAQLIAPFPAAAQRYVEEEVLPKWAYSLSPEALQLARAVGQTLARQTGDRYLLDTVAVIDRAAQSPSTMETLRRGHRAFGDARQAERAGAKDTAARYARAAELLASAGSPLHGGAELGRAVAVSFDSLDRAIPMLEPLERYARRRDYRRLLGRVHSTRAYCFLFAGRFIDSIAEYDLAGEQFAQLDDQENLANIHARKAGVLRTVGQLELAWREASLARRYFSRVVEIQDRHHVLGESASCSQALGYPKIALRYQQMAAQIIQDELANLRPDEQERVPELRKNLAIVMRALGGIELELKHYDRATHDIDEAIRLANEKGDENVRRVLLARIEQVHGQELMHTDAERAVGVFTQALDLTVPGEFRTFRANLYAERAEAQRHAGHVDAAERDLRAALGELQEEESAILKTRERGRGEELWNSYFSRFQETYEQLIRQLVDEHRAEEAFAYAEKARAFDLLNLVLQGNTAPETFRNLAVNGQTLTLPAVQTSLPSGTFLVQYRVLADRTYAWVVSHTQIQLVTETTGSADIDRWSTALQKAARQRNVAAFEAELYAPYDALITPVLGVVEHMAGGKDASRRLVVVPDASIHGLPLAALKSPVTGRYLIQDMPVSVAASATLYVYSLLRDRDLPAKGSRAALIGEPAIDPQLELARGLEPLPRARREVERIREIYAPAAEVCVGKEATVPHFLELARESVVVHLAGHAIANPRAPFLSLLMLAPSPQHNGALEARELLTRLRTDKTRLFVLSACSSAGGSPVGPGGVAPLVRPLIAAGVPAVVGSLWTVGDSTSEDLLVQFHRHYHEGADAAAALRSAQLDLLQNKNPALRSVLTWAPFQVIGYASSPFQPVPRKERSNTP